MWQRLYNVGARKFVIVGIGLIGCTPSERNAKKGEECNEEINRWSTKYSGALVSILKNLKSELKDVIYSYFDSYSAMDNIVRKPASYGIYTL